VSEPQRPFDSARVRPLVTALDPLRRRIDYARFDAAIFSLDAVAADLGYGDVRPLPGSVAWIDRLRREGKRIAVVAAGERASAALELAGIADRVDVVASAPRASERIAGALRELGVAPARAIVVGAAPEELGAARGEGVELAIGVVRGPAAPEALRRAGAVTIVADLQELLGPAAA
jgi:beta-phosphoglucomutase-like phosphatase (HAD superfamily)